MSELWYKQPAETWEQALPLGNGRLGAMVYGTVDVENIQLNEDSVWYGSFVDRNNHSALEHLPRIRELIVSGQIPQAEELMLYALSGTPQSQRPYQTLGEIKIRFPHMQGECTAYKRALNLEDAVHVVTTEVGGITYIREAFISFPDHVLAIRLHSEKGAKTNFSVQLERKRFYNRAYCPSTDTIVLNGNLGGHGLDFGMMLKVQIKGGQCRAIGENIVVEGAEEAVLLFTAGTHFRCKDIAISNAQTLERAVSLGWDKLKARHVADYQSLYSRVSFELQGASSLHTLPTDERLALAQRDHMDMGLPKLYFDFGRYLMIASSRPGTLPANLQGIWNKDMLPPWDAKFTININTEMNYWPAEICNLSECHMPLLDHIKKMLPNGRRTAKIMYGCRGFTAHHNTDIWGDTVTQDQYIPASYWVLGAAWLCTHQWTHYEYTQDRAFLLDSFPIMREAALFFLDFLIEHDGYLKTCPSVSPENKYILPSGVCGSVTAGATMDNQIIRDLFTQCIKAAEILGVEDALNAQIKDAVKKLPPTRIGEDGRILEWCEAYTEAEPGHRHISHLYGLHPSSQITMDGTPALALAAGRTLAYRLSHGGGHTGWSRAWIMNLYAKLWNGEAAFQNLKQLIIQSTLPNLFDNHPPFQIDGNFGATAAIAEMLVQSTMERIVLLPALPSIWSNGFIRGLCTRGGLVVDIEWADSKAVTCRLQALADVSTSVWYDHKGYPIHLKKGETIENLLETWE